MLTALVLTAVLTAVVAALGAALVWADRRYPPDTRTLVESIDGLLPQTQCAQCGYPGCRPYAEAVAAGAAINLCPPGGPETHRALARLLGRSEEDPPQEASKLKARIREDGCIGCYLCVEACPVDAIVGAPRYLHTVLEAACTGCELCVPACPVDCIDMTPAREASPISHQPRRRWPDRQSSPCIRCGACQPACPVGLSPQELLWYAGGSSSGRPTGQAAAATRGLDRCIECGLCNPVCPSNIDLVGVFRQARRAQAARHEAERDAADAKARHARRTERLEQTTAKRAEDREQRIARRSGRQWRA
ncbi:MAG TPA: RnfABCDGE type electron transport complex subunit B [Pseudomonadales bacterium]|jgi:electron transport complex protein RnfB